jgi:drug/metabolite transporter (DMT)-like permease
MSCGVLSALSFSLSNFFIRTKASHIPSSQIMSYRFIIAMVLLTPFIFKEIPLLWKRSCSPLWFRFAGESLALFALFENVKITGLAGATALNNLSSVFVVVGSALLFKDKLSLKEWLGIGVVLTGSFILQSPWGISIPLLGLMVGLSGAFSSGMSLLALKVSASRASALFMVWGFCLLCGVIGFTQWTGPLAIQSSSDWAWLSLVALIGIMGQILMTRAYMMLPAGIASATGLSGLVWSILLESLHKGSVPRITAILAYMMILGGLGVLIKQKTKQRHSKVCPLPQRPKKVQETGRQGSVANS